MSAKTPQPFRRNQQLTIKLFFTFYLLFSLDEKSNKKIKSKRFSPHYPGHAPRFDGLTLRGQWLIFCAWLSTNGANFTEGIPSGQDCMIGRVDLRDYAIVNCRLWCTFLCLFLLYNQKKENKKKFHLRKKVKKKLTTTHQKNCVGYSQYLSALYKHNNW